MQPDNAEGILTAVLESAIDGILVIDGAGVIQLANRAAVTLFGYGAEADLVGRNVNVLMPPADAVHHDGYLQRYLQTGVARIIGIGREVEGRRADGSYFPFRLSVGELTLPDRTLFTGVIHDRSAEHAYEAQLATLNRDLEARVRDRTLDLEEALARLEREIAERRGAEARAEESREDALRALERERELGELKSRFVSLASHEFRTPLSTILSSAELLRRYTTTEQQARRERHVERIRNTVIHLTDLLNDFLSLGRMDEGRLSPQPAPVDLAAALAEFVEYIRPTLKPGQRLRVDTAGAVDEPFRTDLRMLRNILNNLVSNASKYSPPEATISLTLSRDAGTGLRLAVADAGIGIPAAEQPRLFERFFRAHNAEHIQGTGLGLHIVSRYLQMLGGAIAFTSEEGVGSTFTVTIPEAASR